MRMFQLDGIHGKSLALLLEHDIWAPLVPHRLVLELCILALYKLVLELCIHGLIYGKTQ